MFCMHCFLLERAVRRYMAYGGLKRPDGCPQRGKRALWAYFWVLWGKTAVFEVV